MTTPTTPISMSDVNNELGFSYTQTISLGDQYVVNMAGGNHDMNDLRNKSSTIIPYTSSGNDNYTVYDNYGNPQGTGPGYGLIGCARFDARNTPNAPYTYSITSTCARPQYIYCVASAVTGTNNYGNYRVIRADGAVMAGMPSPDGYYDQLQEIRNGRQVFYVGFYDILPAYATYYYYMQVRISDRGDYCYTWYSGVDGVGPITFQFAGYA